MLAISPPITRLQRPQPTPCPPLAGPPPASHRRACPTPPRSRAARLPTLLQILHVVFLDVISTMATVSMLLACATVDVI